ncbi:SET domain-containing protein-lysine N-methyltransferase [Thiomonas sp.]
MLAFDSGSFFIPACETWKREAAAGGHPEYLGDLLRIRTLVPARNPLKHPFEILAYFGLDAAPHRVGERVWEYVEDIRRQVFTEMLALTCEEYRLDWSREDGAFCLWYRHRDCRRDATRELQFVRQHTLDLFPGTEIRNSGIHGFGLFATREVEAGRRLALLDGQVIRYDTYERLRAWMAPGLGRLRTHFFMEWNALDQEHLLVRPFRTTYSFINHSDHPNLELRRTAGQPELELAAIREIQTGEEFVLDYRQESLPRGYFETPGAAYLRPGSPHA